MDWGSKSNRNWPLHYEKLYNALQRRHKKPEPIASNAD